MPEYTHAACGIKGQQIYAAYQQQELDREEAGANANGQEPRTCYFCKLEIRQNQPLNLHHPIYKSNGGTQVEPAHERCHVEYHRKQGDFRHWGRQSALTRAWAFNLKNVRTNPAYEFDRQYYLMLYAH